MKLVFDFYKLLQFQACGMIAQNERILDFEENAQKNSRLSQLFGLITVSS